MDTDTNITFVLSDELDTIPINPIFNAELLGTTSDKTINLLSDADGNQAVATSIQGGATVQFTGESSDFTYVRNGTRVEVQDAEGNLVADVGAPFDENSPTTLKFADGSATVFGDPATASLVVGGQVLANDEDAIDGSATDVITDAADVSDIATGTGGGTVTDVDLDAEGSTAAAPASVDADGGAFNFTDDVATQSFTDIANFGADDELTFSGVTADEVNVSSSGGNTDIQFDDGAGTVSSIQLTGVDGFFGDVASFNNDQNMGDITFAGDQSPGDDEGTGDTGGGDTGGGDTGGGTVTEVDLDAEGGTPAGPASVDADGGAFNFSDTLAAQSSTEIANFGADDELTFSGVTADDITVSVSSGNTDIQFDDGAGTVSSITLVGVDRGFTFDVASFNAAGDGDITFA